jgi:hypothetical protein
MRYVFKVQIYTFEFFKNVLTVSYLHYEYTERIQTYFRLEMYKWAKIQCNVFLRIM